MSDEKRRSTDRIDSYNDHDKIITLIEIAANQEKLFANHTRSYQEHLDDDKTNFKDISHKLENLVNAKYLVIGAFIVINFLFKLWH